MPETQRAAGRRRGVARVGPVLLVVLAVVAATAGPARTAAPTHEADTGRSVVGAAPVDTGHRHLGASRTVRVQVDAGWRHRSPLGRLPAGALLALLTIALVAVARCTPVEARRPRAPFARRGPPALRTAG